MYIAHASTFNDMPARYCTIKKFFHLLLATYRGFNFVGLYKFVEAPWIKAIKLAILTKVEIDSSTINIYFHTNAVGANFIPTSLVICCSYSRHTANYKIVRSSWSRATEGILENFYRLYLGGIE